MARARKTRMCPAVWMVSDLPVGLQFSLEVAQAAILFSLRLQCRTDRVSESRHNFGNRGQRGGDAG